MCWVTNPDNNLDNLLVNNLDTFDSHHSKVDPRDESASKSLQSGLLPKRKMCEKMQRGRSSSIMIF